MAAAQPSDAPPSSFDRLRRTLVVGARRDRAVLGLLVAYAAIWTLYATISRSSQGLHPDMTELIAWSRDLSFGYLKHPPFAAWLVRGWFSILPLTEWSYYLFSVLMPTAALWIAWRASADYLDAEKRLIGLALLTFVPFYNFLAIKLNVNTVLLPTWAATTFWFLRSYRTHSTVYAVLTGLGAGACMLAKYWSVFLLAGFLVAALIDARRSCYFRSPAPWIAAGVGAATLTPHVIWLWQHNFAPFEYALAQHAGGSILGAAARAISYLAGSLAYAAVPILTVAFIARPNWTTLTDVVWPADRERRLVAVTFFAPLVLPLGSALFGGADLTSLWSMSAWTLFPIMLLSPKSIQFSPLALRGILQAAMALPPLMLIVAPVVAIVAHINGANPLAAAQGPLLAAEVERAWHEVTPQPLRFVGCDAANIVVTYAQEAPHALPMRAFHGDVGDTVYAAAFGWPPPAEDVARTEALASQDGVLLACQGARGGWIDAAAKYAGTFPTSRRLDIEITRSFWGFAGRPQHYVIFIVPPRG